MSAQSPSWVEKQAAPWLLLNQVLAGTMGFIHLGMPGLLCGALLVISLDRIAGHVSHARRG